MRITDVKAHHIRIPFDAGAASFRQGASAIAALDMVIVEVLTDAGLIGWGDAFAYVCPKTTLAAIDEMIAPQARGFEVPDAAGIPAFMERIQRNLHLFGRYGITMFAISGLDIALWDLAGKIKGVPLHSLIGPRKRARIPGYASLLRIGTPEAAAGENACTVHQFRQMMQAGAVSYAQPSVTKVGGITEYLKIVALADEMGIKLAPHSPYFGPGLLATLQLLSLRDDGTFVEMFYMTRPACLWRGGVDTGADGAVAVPEGPGLGYEPGKEVLERYRVSLRV